MIRAFLHFLAATAVLCGAAKTGSPDYISVRSLDEFGHSVQLKHAREAACRHGRLVVAARSVEGDTVVVSVGDTPMVHRLTLPVTDGSLEPAPTVAIVAVGIKGDAAWLVSEVRSHVQNAWRWYGHHMDGAAVAHVISRAMGNFLGEDIKEEWRPASSPNGGSDGQENKSNVWARPLGVQVMVLSSSPLDGDENMTVLFIEPSGRILSTSSPEVLPDSTSSPNRYTMIEAMGRDSRIVHDRVKRRPIEVMDTEKLTNALIDLIVKEIISGEGKTNLLVEKLSSDGGIQRTIVIAENMEWTGDIQFSKSM